LPDASSIAAAFMARYPHADLVQLSLTPQDDCAILSCESRAFVQTDDLRHLVGVGPVVVDPATGACFPFLSTHDPEAAVQRWRQLCADNAARAQQRLPPLHTDTTRHPLTFDAARWVAREAGWGGLVKMMDVAGRGWLRPNRIGQVDCLERRLAPGEVWSERAGPPRYLRVFFDTATLQIGSDRQGVPAGGDADIPAGQPFTIGNDTDGAIKLMLLAPW